MHTFETRLNDLLRRRHERIPLLATLLAAGVFLAICFAILAGGYMPTDDANRHAAKIVSGKSWAEILVVRDDFLIDTQPGWHCLLGWMHRLAGLDAEGLVIFSVVAIFLLVTIVPMLLLQRRAEAWLLAYLALAVASNFHIRFMLGRPFMFTVLNTMVMLMLWRRLDAERAPRGVLLALVGLTALCTWMHATTWFLYLLPVGAYALVGRWRAGTRLGIAVAVGVLAGVCLTGHPGELLFGMPRQVFASMGQSLLPEMRVTELQPTPFPLLALLLAALLPLFRRAITGSFGDAWRQPALALALGGAVLGQVAARFWCDWGMIALLVWNADQAADLLDQAVPVDSGRRLATTAAAGIALFIAFVHGPGAYWRDSFRLDYWRHETAEADERQWFPEPGGIVYSPTMDVFYRCFYANPTAPWRYQLGFEPSLMPEDDLQTYQRILWNQGDVEALAPWLAKMRPEDRLVLAQAGRPPLPQLEWHLAVRRLWVGRLPR